VLSGRLPSCGIELTVSLAAGTWARVLLSSTQCHWAGCVSDGQPAPHNIRNRRSHRAIDQNVYVYKTEKETSCRRAKQDNDRKRNVVGWGAKSLNTTLKLTYI